MQTWLSLKNSTNTINRININIEDYLVILKDEKKIFDKTQHFFSK